MGGVCGGDPGHERQSKREQYLDCSDGGRRGRSAYAERTRYFAGMVARRKDASVFVITGREFAGVRVVDGRWRGARGDASLDWRGYGEVVARREDNYVYVVGVPGLQR